MMDINGSDDELGHDNFAVEIDCIRIRQSVTQYGARQVESGNMKFLDRNMFANRVDFGQLIVLQPPAITPLGSERAPPQPAPLFAWHTSENTRPLLRCNVWIIW